MRFHATSLARSAALLAATACGTLGFASAAFAADKIYVVDNTTNAVYEYPEGATGTQGPSITISGAATLLNKPRASTEDAAGDLWVQNADDSVLEFAPGASGDAKPVRQISAPGGAGAAWGIAIDSVGHIYDTYSDNSIAEFEPWAHGAAAPIATTSEGGYIYGLATDAHGYVYDSNYDAGQEGWIAKYKSGLTQVSNLTGPYGSLFGEEIDGPWSVAAFPDGRTVIADTGGDGADGNILAFPAGAANQHAPYLDIWGDNSNNQSPSTHWPFSVAVGSDGSIYATGYSNGMLNQYAPSSASGADVPEAQLDLAASDPGDSNYGAAEISVGPAVNIPTVGSVRANEGPLAGGNTVTITGSGFVYGTKASFGGVASPSVRIASPTTLYVKVPAAQSTGTVDVTVTTPAGTSATSSSDHYTYEPQPTVTSLSPTSGPAAGGNAVMIDGSGFVNGTVVHFGTATATIKTRVPTAMKVIAPAGTSGTTVDVTVTTPGGKSTATTADRYTYQ